MLLTLWTALGYRDQVAPSSIVTRYGVMVMEKGGGEGGDDWNNDMRACNVSGALAWTQL